MHHQSSCSLIAVDPNLVGLLFLLTTVGSCNVSAHYIQILPGVGLQSYTYVKGLCCSLLLAPAVCAVIAQRAQIACVGSMHTFDWRIMFLVMGAGVLIVHVECKFRPGVRPDGSPPFPTSCSYFKLICTATN